MRPPHAYLPPVFQAGRTWGFGINLYALRSKRNWGIGDFTDLRAFVRHAATLGAGVVGVNPLHALHYVEPEAASPYSPTSRYFRNPLYIDVESVPEFATGHERAVRLRERVRSEPFAEMLASLRAMQHVAYGRVARAKYSALEECYAVFRELRGERLVAFRDFAERGADRLERFAVYETLAERFTRDDGRERGWLAWPNAYRDANGDDVRAFAAKERRRVDYFKYLQWLADDQLADVAAAARDMPIGLYLDIAVGVDRNSADVWSDPRAYALDQTIGAPPDPLGPAGQNWGLPPPDPTNLIADGGAAFEELLAKNMAYAGALRLDHVMGLLRLFCIPVGGNASDGRYVDYPFEELLALAASASVGTQCMIVGEDLGNVPDGFRDRMAREAIFSYRLLLFERGDDGAFRLPHEYPERALATATTHDLPTLPGWALGNDLATRASLGLASQSERDEAHLRRRGDVTQLLAALEAAGELDAESVERLHRTVDARPTQSAALDDLVRAAYRFLARSPARLVLIQLDDALGEFDQVNVPGTASEYPNWRRKSSLDLDGIAGNARLSALAADVHHILHERVTP
ncbi:MAG: 4-alpha-glucanotransferase [Vulcanimicrobiaceae bacterium]